MIDHSLAGSMQSLNILLLDALLWDEGNIRRPRGCADRLGVIAVVHLPAHEGLHILRAGQWK